VNVISTAKIEKLQMYGTKKRHVLAQRLFSKSEE